MIQAKKKHCDGPCDSDQYIWKNHEGKKYCKNCWGMCQGELTKSSNLVEPTNKKRYQIPSRSPKRTKEDKIYAGKRIIFLTKHPMCHMAIPGICTKHATTIQHLKGRTGDLFLDEEEWMPACWPCHSYADTHPEEAIEKGWAKLRLTPKENGK